MDQQQADTDYVVQMDETARDPRIVLTVVCGAASALWMCFFQLIG